MKYSSVFALLFIAGLSINSSCNKDDDPGTQSCPMTVASLSNTYKLTSLRFKPSGGMESEIINSLMACQRDDLLTLNSNTVFTYQDAGVVCAPSGSFSGDWSITGSTLRLELEMGTITSWNCTDLVYYVNNKPAAGDRMTYTYTKQ